MKTIIGLFFLLLLVAGCKKAGDVPVYQGNLIFSSQSDIDHFDENYPGCTEINGKVRIQGDDITNLVGLKNLRRIGDTLEIGSVGGAGNPSLTSLHGLGNLTFVGNELLIYCNPLLVNLDGLQGLDSITGALTIGSNEAMADLTGIDGISYIGGDVYFLHNPALASLTGFPPMSDLPGGLIINNCPALTDLSCLQGLISIGGSLGFYQCHGLTNFSGLEGLNSVEGGISVYDNDGLVTLAGLEGLTSIGDELSISFNDALTSLEGLDNIGSAALSYLMIYDNPSLSTCDAEIVRDFLSSPTGTVEIFQNAPGCNTVMDVAKEFGISLPCLPFGNYYLLSQADIDHFPADFPGCTELQGNVRIFGNDITNLDGLSAITSICGGLYISDHYLGGNPNLTSLSGLNNLTSILSGIEISNCDVLTSLEGLENLTWIGSHLYILNNNSLTSLEGLSHINPLSLVELHIRDNHSLSRCEIQSICDYLAIPDRSSTIENNASGCNSKPEVEAACQGLFERGHSPESKTP